MSAKAAHSKTSIVVSIIVAISLMASILTVTFQILLLPAPTQIFASIYVKDSLSPLTHDELVDTAVLTLDYTLGDPDAHLSVGTDYRVSYTSDVVEHLDDVASVFKGTRIAALISISVLAISFLLLWVLCRKVKNGDTSSNGRPHFEKLLSKILLIAPIATMCLVVVVTLAAISNFDMVFAAMHMLFFSSGNWIFQNDSLLICSLPEMFWISMGALWVVSMAIVSALLIVAGIVTRRHLKKNSCSQSQKGNI